MKNTESAVMHCVMLAKLLERMDGPTRTKAPDPAQYRLLAQRLAISLDAIDDRNALDAILSAFPAAAQLYENLRYEHAGLCRSGLDASLAGEQSARRAIERARRLCAEDSTPPAR